jgi:exonuclease SbcC
MYITKIQLENIKSHAKSSFEFGSGTTAITGENGAGKTTLLEAVAWALFDVLDYKKDDFIRRGAKKGTVRVSFVSDLDQREYRVYRDTSGGYYLYDPGLSLKLAEKKQDVAAMLRQRLGVEPGTDLEDLFRHAIGVPQGTFTSAFLETPSARKAAFDKLLKVEEYRHSAELLLDTARLVGEKTRAVRERIAFAEGKLADYDRLSSELKEVERSGDELSASIAVLDQRIVTLMAATAEWDAAVKRLVEAANLTARLKIESANATRRLTERQTEWDRAAEAVARRRTTEPAHQIHLEALARLEQLEQSRQARDEWARDVAELEKRIAVAAQELRRIEEAVGAAVLAGEAAAALAPAVETQIAAEAEREHLRNARAEAASAAQAMAQLDTEREGLRAEYAQLREQVRAAQSGALAEERLDQLRELRRKSETELARLQTMENSRQHLTRQREELTREADGLRTSITERERQTVDGRELRKRAATAEALQSRETELADTLAQLRAKQSHNEKMQSEVQNGLCPILSQKCLNLSPDETLDDYFRDQFTSFTERVLQFEQERAAVGRDVRAAREAEMLLTRWEAARQQLASERKLLGDREAAIRRIDAELGAIPTKVSELVADQRRTVAAIEEQDKKASAGAVLFAQLKSLRLQLEQVEARGTRLTAARAELSSSADRLAEFEQALADNERKLAELEDPRARLAALTIEAERLEPLRGEEATAAVSLRGLEYELGKLDAERARFAALDEALVRTTSERDDTLEAHHEYLANEPLAETFASREAELTEARDEVERIDREAAAAQEESARTEAAYDPERHLADQLALSATRDELAGGRALLQARQDQAATLRTELERLDEVRDSLRDELREREELVRLAQVTDFIRDTLKQAGPLVARSYLYNISVEANQLFREITGDAGRTLRWTEDYEVMLEEEGHERPFQNLSGGEQMAAALAVRLALLKQLSDIRIAFFDEPTANLDVERRERLAQQISQVEHFDQLFIISHDDTFAESVDHIVNLQRPNAA